MERDNEEKKGGVAERKRRRNRYNINETDTVVYY